MPYVFDPYYLILVVPALVLALLAQGLVKSTFDRFDKVRSSCGLTGQQAARTLLTARGLSQVRIERVSGRLSDNYDPRTEVLHLSAATIASASVAAIGVAAHEAGHAVQHAEQYLPNRIRALLVPVANLGSQAGPYLAILGIVFEFGLLINLGILLYSVAVLFYLVTLPVEFDASRRAISMLGDAGLLSPEELDGARKVLRAAAFTYVASALVALASLFRLLLMARSGRRR
jgi:Zn-dependent membrane protease YugP